MNRILRLLARGLVITALFSSGFTPFVNSASATTSVCGSQPGSSTWSLANSPYEVCGTGVIVPAGATLTIAPGVSVQFVAQAGNLLNVQGTLIATGTPTQTITLTGVSPSPGSWGGISASGSLSVPASVNLDYVSLVYGGVSGSYGAALYADLAEVSINHSEIHSSAGNGIYASYRAKIDVQNTNLVGNNQNAIQLNQPSTSLLMTGLTASGNGTDGVRVAGSSTFHGQKRWTFPGVPYIVDGPVATDLGDELTIDPGNTLAFTSNGWLNIRGRLNAIGTPSQPITLTAQIKTAGAWRGLFIDGGLHEALAQLDYVTIEYAGNDINGANIEVANGRLNVHHSIIRYSLKDGVRFDSNWGGSILESQIVDNTLYGIRNQTPQRAVLATNNWWGDPNGPQSDIPACSLGMGSKVSTGILFTPVLTSTLPAATLPLSNAPILTITPRRWFAPADGLTRVYFDLALRDGNGLPLPGRTVKLSSSLGNTADGGITDVRGKTIAYLTSTSTGDAMVLASLDAMTACEGALSPETRVTFTTPVSVTDLMPGAPSPYFDGEIEVSPLPVVTGISTTMTAKLVNPLSQAITVDVSFGFAQSGIGLVFGPIKDIVGLVIPANSSVSLSAGFLPVVSGHYCVQVTYAITAIGPARVLQPQAGSKMSRNRNLNVFQGSTGPPSSKDALDKADKAFKLVSKLPSGPTQIQKGILGKWWGAMKDTASGISRALGFDPPRQDYDQLTLPVQHPIPPVLPDANISSARAQALNAVSDALVDIEAFGTAAATAMDRYGGASEANNLQWASEQANALIFYSVELGNAMLTYADRLEAFIQVLQTEGETALAISVSEVTAYQQRLANQGFSSEEIANMKLLDWTDADIETYRQEIIAANPTEVAGNIVDLLTNEAAIGRALGNTLLHPPIFNSSLSVSGGAGLRTNATGNTMVQIYNSETTVQLSNPLTQTVQINLSTRRIDLPADWSAYVSPAQITLAPGEQIIVSVSLIAGSPVPQGSRPSLAVEATAGSQLLGGVLVEINIPSYMPFDGKLHVYLPVMRH